MKTYSLSHLSDQALLRDLATLVARDRATTAQMLAHIAEVDDRRLYLPKAFPSMSAYCVGELRLSEDAAFKRIKAARAARRFPEIFEALAEGRLHLSAVVLLAPHLTEDTAGELLAAAIHRSKSQIEQLLAERFPRTDMLAWVESMPTSSGTPSAVQLAPGPVEDGLAPGRVGAEGQHAPAHVEDRPAPGRVGEDPQHAPGHVEDRSRVESLSAESFAVQFTLSRRGHDHLRYAQELLGHQIPSGDIAQVFERALDALIPELERRKFAATDRPRTGRPRSAENTRHVPAHVRRTVWERDEGRCTFVSETGRRCEARERIEFDHIDEVARGGEATVTGIRLRCRAHNQYGAECTFGPEFMRHKRIAAAESRAAAKVRAAAARDQAQTVARVPATVPGGIDEDRDVVPWLRQLGFSAAEARRAAERCESIPDAPLEQRVRVALSCFGKRSARVGRAEEGFETATALTSAIRGGDGP